MQTCFLAQIVSTGGAAQLVKGYGLDMEKPQLPENHAFQRCSRALLRTGVT